MGSTVRSGQPQGRRGLRRSRRLGAASWPVAAARPTLRRKDVRGSARPGFWHVTGGDAGRETYVARRWQWPTVWNRPPRPPVRCEHPVVVAAARRAQRTRRYDGAALDEGQLQTFGACGLVQATLSGRRVPADVRTDHDLRRADLSGKGDSLGDGIPVPHDQVPAAGT